MKRIDTHPIKSGRQLRLNANTESDGWIRVGVVDEWGKDISGLGYADCLPISGDSLRHEVKWQQGQTMAKLPGQIRLRIRSRKASIYAFYIA